MQLKLLRFPKTYLENAVLDCQSFSVFSGSKRGQGMTLSLLSNLIMQVFKAFLHILILFFNPLIVQYCFGEFIFSVSTTIHILHASQVLCELLQHVPFLRLSDISSGMGQDAPLRGYPPPQGAVSPGGGHLLSSCAWLWVYLQVRKSVALKQLP